MAVVTQAVGGTSIQGDGRGGRESERFGSDVGQGHFHQFHLVGCRRDQGGDLGAQAQALRLAGEALPEQASLQGDLFLGAGNLPACNLQGRAAARRPGAQAGMVDPEITPGAGLLQILHRDRRQQEVVLVNLGVSVQGGRHRRHHARLVDQWKVQIRGVVGIDQLKPPAIINEIPGMCHRQLLLLIV